LNIFLSNDDGIDCNGVHALARALRGAGHRVLAVVPDRNRSGQSHSITFDDPLPMKEIAEDTWTCAGTPCDCALTVLMKGGFDFKPDIVVSGINEGENLGTDIVYSGTAAVARQGALSGLPGIAFSLYASSDTGKTDFFWEKAAAWSAERLDMLVSLWRPNIFVNVNYPNTRDFADWVFTWPSFREYEDIIHMAQDADGQKSARLFGGKVHEISPRMQTIGLGSDKDAFSFQMEAAEKAKMPLISDWDAVLDNKVSVSLVCNHPVAVAFDSTAAKEHLKGGGNG
jgi:5'-nucleotidase